MSTNISENQPKKRGRPRKTDIAPKTKTFSFKDLEKNDSDEELILHLPIHPDSDDESNSDSDDGFAFKESEVKTKTIESLTHSSGSDNLNMEELNLQVKRQEAQIMQLKNTIKELKSTTYQENNIQNNKDNKKIVSGLKLFSLNDNKPIAVDKTDLLCHWDHHKFDTLPCFLPERFARGAYYVFGCFCSFACMQAYNSDLGERGDYRAPVRKVLIKKMYNTIFNNDKDVPKAHHWLLLTEYGGHLTIDKFRDINTICKKEYKMNIPPMIPLISHIEEINKEVKVDVYKVKPSNNDTDLDKVIKESSATKKVAFKK